MHREQLRILLLQARNDIPTQQEELGQFVTYSGLEAAQFSVLNGFDQADFLPDVMQGFDALFIGGSSDATVLKPDVYPFVPPSQALILHCIEHRIPVFASCFGFQLAVQALGGRVIVDRDNMEMGSYPITLTAAAASDPLLQGFPPEFLAISGHQERAVSLPSEAIHLAASARCPFHAFTLPGQPFYAFQFHPEVNRQDLLTRISRYCNRYLDDPNALDQICQTTAETPIANQLIGRFVADILLGPGT